MVRDDPGLITEEPEPLIETLAENALARPIADSLLRSAYELTTTGTDGETIVRGSVDALEEAHDRLDDLVQPDGQVPGGGSSEVALGSELRRYVDSVTGRKLLVVEATADALETVVSMIARQAGIDPFETECLELIHQRSQGNVRQALSLCSRVLDAAADDGVDEVGPDFVRQALNSA